MATSKTLTPTNVTIQIPEFTDQPDQRVNSNCIDKEADAINALNQAIGNKTEYTTIIATSYAYNAKESYDFVYDELPTTYVGMVRINFSGGYWVFGMAYKYSNIYGSICTIVNDNVLPFYYTRSNSSYGKLEQLAQKSAKVQGTMPAINTTGKVANYPDGYSVSNCHISSAYSAFDNNRYAIPDNQTAVWLKNDGIYMYTASGGYAGKAVVVYLELD